MFELKPSTLCTVLEECVHSMLPTILTCLLASAGQRLIRSVPSKQYDRVAAPQSSTKRKDATPRTLFCLAIATILQNPAFLLGCLISR